MKTNLPTKIIETKFIAWTNNRPSRIKAFDGGGNKIIVSKDSLEGNDFEQHRSAAEKLMYKMGWKGNLIGGGTKNGYAFAIID